VRFERDCRSWSSAFGSPIARLQKLQSRLKITRLRVVDPPAATAQRVDLRPQTDAPKGR